MYRCIADILFILFGFSCFAFVEYLLFLVKSKPLKMEVSRKVTLPPMVSFLCLGDLRTFYLPLSVLFRTSRCRDDDAS